VVTSLKVQVSLPSCDARQHPSARAVFCVSIQWHQEGCHLVRLDRQRLHTLLARVVPHQRNGHPSALEVILPRLHTLLACVCTICSPASSRQLDTVVSPSASCACVSAMHPRNGTPQNGPIRTVHPATRHRQNKVDTDHDSDDCLLRCSASLIHHANLATNYDETEPEPSLHTV
jgi:hypothetical protein